ncbi:MAG: glycine betaine ABC transporter substrate-binding protein [Thermodesulfobacteriota bacterium]
MNEEHRFAPRGAQGFSSVHQGCCWPLSAAGAAALCLLLLLAFGCGQGDTETLARKQKDRDEPVRIVYVDWASEKASAHVAQAVIEEKLGRKCRLLEVTLVAMWQSLAAGDQDASVAAWLPSLQAKFLDTYRTDVQNLGPNLTGTRIGLVVPDYVPVDSISELSEYAEQFEHKIIGIDPHAGIMNITKKALREYGLNSFSLVSGSGSTMTSALEQAVQNREWIVVTGWTPHLMFARWDLKYLEDPGHVYGDKEHIATIVRPGLQEDMPRVYAFLDAFSWTARDMADVMLKSREEGVSYAQAAKEWVLENESRVASWLP